MLLRLSGVTQNRGEKTPNQSDLLPLSESISNFFSVKLIFSFKLPFNTYLGPLGFVLWPAATGF